MSLLTFADKGKGGVSELLKQDMKVIAKVYRGNRLYTALPVEVFVICCFVC